ncbi:hypothetical protein C362_05038 [Cryptococcus neoformans Bt1]|nr:hypothetical protein C362_05038 [Cryptococcus neoformans var. grubii Bt1]
MSRHATEAILTGPDYYQPALSVPKSILGAPWVAIENNDHMQNEYANVEKKFQKVHNALNECSRKLNTSRKIDPGTLDFPGRCSRSRSDSGDVGKCSLCNQRTAILVLWGRNIFNILRFFLTKEVERGSMLLANEGELQRATSLLLNGLLGLFTDLCAAWENGRRLKHLDSDEAFWLFESEGVTEAERIEALKAK